MQLSEEQIGLTTYEALGILHDEIARILQEFSPKMSSRWNCMKSILNPKNENSKFTWISAIYVIFNSVCLVYSSFYTNAALYGNLIGHGTFIFGIGALNILLVSWDNELRQNEIPERVKNLLLFVKECQQKCVWRAENYPHLCSPFSPCVTLQWAYRDNRLVNLPWALLCKGDVIVLKPGQAAPGNVMQQDNHSTFLAGGDVYNPPQRLHESISAPTARIPLKNKRFILTETPLVRNVREVLEDSKNKKCLTPYDKQIYLITVKIFQNLVVPVLLVCSLLLGLLKTIYIGQWITNAHWTVTFLLIPSCIIMPIIPFCFPVAWIALHTLGNAKLSAFLQSSSTTKTADPFEDVSYDDQRVEDISASLKWGQHFFHALLGKQHSLALTRSSNPLHILGSVTALCCVDKKGILSWPNPSADKIFFLKTGDKTNLTRDTTINDNNSVAEQADILPDAGAGDTKPINPKPDIGTISEVLDLTHDSSCPFKLHFDDTRWAQHLGSLKPIGLAVLLNTCNMGTHEHYVQFCSHITCEALYNEDLVPVTNRRCLCELSKQIGFTENVKNGYYLMEQLCTFRHVQPETVRRDIKFARSLAFATKLKLPFPHMVAVVTSEAAVPNSLQLFSQATGEIAVDSCVDFWDGVTVKPLTAFERKKIMDFYQRSSLTAYCTAFAYRPLGRPVNSELSRVYMELPADSQALYVRNRSPTPIDGVLHQSTDSLLNEEVAEEINDIEECFEMQCNQVFLGMVTMQYQAQIEMVQLIEQLERACIRFVHFSKENELRSRVFSEKMGLESGWNCHISLLSSSLEGSRAMSVSAPCAINTESSKDNPDGTKAKDEEFEVISQDGWQSLSCLSDSTEQSAPINFDMSNRAKLPRGIDQIRPHLEQVDNVPLLVSLFTDCTPSTTQQMIEIMQDYGEVVCVIGSSANADNSSIFLKANASVSIEPLFPQVCQKVPAYVPLLDSVSPIQLSGRLNSLPCCVSITRQRPVSLFHLIMHARHFMLCLWNCIQFWLCSVTALCFLQLITIMVMLPPLLSAGEVLWLSSVVIPLLSVSLVSCPINIKIMSKPVAKRQWTVNSEVAVFVAWCYGSKFLPMLLSIPLIYGATLTSFCQNIAALHNGTCTLVYPLSQSPVGGWEQNFYPLATAQLLATSVLVLQLVIISMSFVHREHLSWKRNPFKNKTWLAASGTLLGVQCSYFLISILVADLTLDYELKPPWFAFILAGASLALTFLVNEFVKWQEIKANLRYEKRARLDFGTKLGMNSPF